MMWLKLVGYPFVAEYGCAHHKVLSPHDALAMPCCAPLQVYCELAQYQSLRFLDPLGSLLDGCTADEAAAAAASPAFMCGAVLLPLMDTLMCQVRCSRPGCCLSCWHNSQLLHWH